LIAILAGGICWWTRVQLELDLFPFLGYSSEMLI
jgi:hypothetical protein